MLLTPLFKTVGIVVLEATGREKCLELSYASMDNLGCELRSFFFLAAKIFSMCF